MAARGLFARYVADRRGEQIPSFDRDDRGYVVRYTARAPGDDGCVVFTSLVPGREDAQIAAEVAHFRERSQSFEWKVYAFDEPRDLADRLAAAGFVAAEAETLLIGDLTAFVPPPPGPVDVRRVVDDAGLDAVVDLQARVHGGDFAWLRRALGGRLHAAPETVSIFCASRDGAPVGGGWIDYPVGSRLPQLYGGAVLPDVRRQGIYRALLDVRRRDAVARGHDALCVDALPTSRPILERLGFTPVCATVPMRMRFDP